MLTLSNIKNFRLFSPVPKRRVQGENSKPKYRLEETLLVQLSNRQLIKIRKGFVWDGSSVPRFLWWLLPPDGDFEVAALIHDYLYVNRNNPHFKDWNTRKFADDEMLKWSKTISGTKRLFSWRNLDNWTRWFFVRLFGWLVWKDYVKIK